MTEHRNSHISRKELPASTAYVWNTLLESWEASDNSELQSGLVIERELALGELFGEIEPPAVLRRLSELSVCLTVEIMRFAAPDMRRDEARSARIDIAAEATSTLPLPLNSLSGSLSLRGSGHDTTLATVETRHSLGRFNPLRIPVDETIRRIQTHQLDKLAHSVTPQDRAA